MNEIETEAILKKYEKQGFNCFQMAQIRRGLEDGLDVSIYADKKLSWLEMMAIRLKLEDQKALKGE